MQDTKENRLFVWIPIGISALCFIVISVFLIIAEIRFQRISSQLAADHEAIAILTNKVSVNYDSIKYHKKQIDNIFELESSGTEALKRQNARIRDLEERVSSAHTEIWTIKNKSNKNLEVFNKRHEIYCKMLELCDQNFKKIENKLYSIEQSVAARKRDVEKVSPQSVKYNWLERDKSKDKPEHFIDQFK